MYPVIVSNILIYLIFNLIITSTFQAPAGDTNLFQLLIIHNNDMHSRFEETNVHTSGTCHLKTERRRIEREPQPCVGGFARIAHQVRKYRMMATEGQGPPVLYLNAGDTYQGTAWYSVHKWRIVSDFLNSLQPDAMCLGNHEFDDGINGLAPFVQAAKFPILAANLNTTLEPTLDSIKKSVILNVAGQKIGVIGYVTPETATLSSPGHVQFTDEILAINEEAHRMDQNGIKIIIALGHSGFEMDKRIAAEVPLIDLVIGGHTNTFMWNGPKPDREEPIGPYPVVVKNLDGRKVPVVQAYAYTKYLGFLNCTFNSRGELVKFGGDPLLLNTELPQDEDILDMVEKYRKEVDEMDKIVIGKSRVMLDQSQDRCRTGECIFGNIIADAAVDYLARKGNNVSWTDYPVGLIQGGGIRTTIDPFQDNGKITRGELLASLPFSNTVVALKLIGKDLLGVLEQGVRSNGETSYGEFLQFSGIHVKYNLSAPTGSRVQSALIRCGNCSIPRYEPLDAAQIYGVVTFNFLVNGGDGFTILRDKSFDKQLLDYLDVDLVAQYIKDHSPIWGEESGRIEILAERQQEGGDKSNGNIIKSTSSLTILALVYLQLLLSHFI